MTAYRFREYREEHNPPGNCFAVWVAGDLVGLILLVGAVRIGIAILKFVGWL